MVDGDFFLSDGTTLINIPSDTKTISYVINDGQATFSIKGTVAVGNTLSINEDAADPDGPGEFHSWQTSSDGSNWNSVSSASTYVVASSDEGKSIKAVISYQDGQGFNETVPTSFLNIPYVNNGQASFSIDGTAAVGNILRINRDSDDPDADGTLSYSWQTSSDGEDWNEVSTASTYLVTSSEEGKSIKAVISYQDGQGFNETVPTSFLNIPYVNNGQASFSINGTAAVGNTLSINEETSDNDGFKFNLVEKIYSTNTSFAAFKNDGSVIWWGLLDGREENVSDLQTPYLKKSFPRIELGSGIEKIITNDGSKVIDGTASFAALKNDGSVVTWGSNLSGGDSSSVSSQLSSDVSQIFSTDCAFAALKNDGSVVTWGDNSYGE